MRRLIAVLLYVLPGVFAVLLTFNLLFPSNSHKLIYEELGLVLIVGMALAAGIDNVRRAWGRPLRISNLLLVATGPLILFVGVPAWISIANRFQIPSIWMTAGFSVLLVGGMTLVGYSIYLWLSRPH